MRRELGASAPDSELGASAPDSELDAPVVELEVRLYCEYCGNSLGFCDPDFCMYCYRASRELELADPVHYAHAHHLEHAGVP